MFMKKRWKRASQGAFLYKLGLLLKKGYSINKSIELLKSQLRKNEQVFLDETLEMFAAGNPLLAVFSRLKLPEEIVSSLSINSANGNLAESLMENGTYMKKKAEWGDRLNKTLRYPLFLLFLTSWISFLFYHFLFPQFALLFTSLEVKTPAFTSHMLAFLAQIPIIGISILLTFVLCGSIVFMIQKKAKPSTHMSLLMTVPFLNKYLKLINSHFFSINFGSMLKSGLSVTDALKVMEQHMNRGFFKEESKRLKKGLLEGNTLPDLINNKHYYSQELAEIIRFGQAHGNLGTDLIQYGEWLFVELEEKILSWLQKLQPILFAAIGGFVLLLFASMLLPMFKLMDAL